MPLNTPRRLCALAFALIAAASMNACGSKPASPPPAPARTAHAALQKATDGIRSDFKDVVSMNAAIVGGMPCDKKCWSLKHLETDDVGRIPQSYNEAVEAYKGSGQTVPPEVELWKTAAEQVLADIKTWDASANMTGGVAKHSPQAKQQVLDDLDKADVLVGQVAND